MSASSSCRNTSPVLTPRRRSPSPLLPVVPKSPGKSPLTKVKISMGEGIASPSNARCVKNGDNAITEIKKTHPNVDITTMQLDLASFKSVLAFVAAYKATGKPLNLLINNAGIMACPRTLTVDGFESQFGVNHLGHFLLTNELLPLLVASGTSASPSRVINLSSFGNWLMSSPSGIKFDDLWAERSYSPYSRYGESKLANILFTRELSRRLVQQNQNVITVSVHPGVILSTGLNKHTDFATISSAMSAMWRRKGAFAEFSRDKGKDIPAGASTTVYA
eukprot:gene24639-31007_t